MKKIALLFALLLFSFPALGQANNDNTLTFLGIPVDGSKSAMISALRAKGFTYNRTRDVLTGEFNGQNSMVIIHENHGKVDRVYVVNQSGTRSPSQARIQYNTLLHQLNDSEKYISFDENNPLPEDEDISLKERCRRANELGKDCILISVHGNAAGNNGWNKARGWQCHTTIGETKADVLAKYLYSAAHDILDPLKIKVREYNGINEQDWENDFYILKHTICPSVLVENLFYDNNFKFNFF